MKKIFMMIAFLASSTAFASGNIQKGEELVKKGNCVTCHGEGLNKPIDASYPKLAGQHQDYLYYAMKAYQVGDTNPQVGRGNAIMGGMIKSFSKDELQDIAAYIHSLPGSLVLKK